MTCQVQVALLNGCLHLNPDRSFPTPSGVGFLYPLGNVRR